MREKPSCAWARSVSTRITPACAGKTSRKSVHRLPTWDHPRVCGKNSRGISNVGSGLGSPPRVREKPSALIFCSRSTGITPACAGKTWLGIDTHTLDRDHPRVCGKNFDYGCCYLDFTGSPPRVREKQPSSLIAKDKAGITPACAGKTGSQEVQS